MLEFAFLRIFTRILFALYEPVAQLFGKPPQPKLVVRDSKTKPAELANVGGGAVVAGMAAWTTPQGVGATEDLPRLHPGATDAQDAELCSIWWRDRHIALAYQDVSDRWYWSSYCRKRGWRTGLGGRKEITFDCPCEDPHLKELKDYLSRDAGSE